MAGNRVPLNSNREPLAGDFPTVKPGPHTLKRCPTIPSRHVAPLLPRPLLDVALSALLVVPDAGPVPLLSMKLEPAPPEPPPEDASPEEETLAAWLSDPPALPPPPDDTFPPPLDPDASLALGSSPFPPVELRGQPHSAVSTSAVATGAHRV